MITAGKTSFLLWPAPDCFILSSTVSAPAGVSQVTLASFVATVSGMSLGTHSSSGLNRADPNQDPAQTPCALWCCDYICDGGQAETMGCVNRNAVPSLAYTSTAYTVKKSWCRCTKIFLRKWSSLPNGLPYTSKSLHFPNFCYMPYLSFL